MINIEVAKRVLSKNDLVATRLREFYKIKHKYVVNFMSSPGSGKTSMLEKMSAYKDLKFCVIEGDLQTNRDALRLEQKGILAHQITTGEACHLEAKMIEDALPFIESSLSFKDLEFIFIENVGNLVCPASYDLGANINIVCLSVPEGDDKVLKYPSMFMCADALVISKCDLLPYFDFSVARVKEDINSLRSDVPIFEVNTKDDSLKSLKDFLLESKKQNYTTTYIFK
ncbi:hydrogenase nickel incorporation protein HypB [Helicobacter sp. 11S02629-2]|uniref:hydrogenase nickel incorporation protein HypB n=1 Tax=Helicobacter sp. 11S02629-2 TaxID=1476195 RepID=UPI000BA7327D|nr:hydrogenase nickel incorporation protein HypB [Helicobacter sp. 11S02629-2]PAF42150.1 hydrogenase accessory protein HypB [Helicobacter sp. 11S02629-2]